MKLSVYVLGREVATLESIGDFKSVLTYHPRTQPSDFVSLTMPVRTASYAWDDRLHPIFQMNLPEGYLLQVLQEEFGPHIGADPISLLSVIGRNMVGRLKLAVPGADLESPAKALEVIELLQGDNSEEAFAALVREHASSGVSGVLPKFLDAEEEPQQSNSPESLGRHTKSTLLTRRHIIKGSSRRLPYSALNEHLCTQVVSQIVPAAKTEVSRDGNALVVHRFDVSEDGQPHWGMEDFCVLLGLRPSAKYETTWERIAKAVRTYVPAERRYETFRQLAAILLLTYALRNADCHAKNLALLYTSGEDVHLSPAYDFVTTCIYPGYQNNPPGISFMGKKTWLPGKSLITFISSTFGIPTRDQTTLVEQISDAVADTAPQIKQSIKETPGFRDTGKHMLQAWQEGVSRLRDQRIYAIGNWTSTELSQGISDPPKLKTSREVIGRSPLLGKRSKPRK